MIKTKITRWNKAPRTFYGVKLSYDNPKLCLKGGLIFRVPIAPTIALWWTSDWHSWSTLKRADFLGCSFIPCLRWIVGTLLKSKDGEAANISLKKQIRVLSIFIATIPTHWPCSMRTPVCCWFMLSSIKRKIRYLLVVVVVGKWMLKKVCCTCVQLLFCLSRSRGTPLMNKFVMS